MILIVATNFFSNEVGTKFAFTSFTCILAANNTVHNSGVGGRHVSTGSCGGKSQMTSKPTSSTSRNHSLFAVTGSIHDKEAHSQSNTDNKKNVASDKNPCSGYYRQTISIHIMYILSRNFVGMTQIDRCSSVTSLQQRCVYQPKHESDILSAMRAVSI